MGDGGPEGDGQFHGQNPGILLGKLLRIDVESGVSPYAVPVDNPFVGNSNYAPEIWALGLRNPWRFSFDRLKGDLYIGDVGQNRYEEINFQPAGSVGGQNYGWRITEGAVAYDPNGTLRDPPIFSNISDLTFPVARYDHLALPTDLSGSVTGGYVYCGPNEPRMDGIYFFGDFSAGWIWGLKQVGADWRRFELITPTDPFLQFRISTFGEDDQGHIYIANYNQGRILKILDSRQVWIPTFSPLNGIASSSSVSVACITTDAIIHYTTNGIDPTEIDSVIPSNGIIPVSSGTTNKARAFRADLAPSEVASIIYKFKTGTPVFTPAAGPITNNVSVEISTATPDAKIYYTLDGSNPTTDSMIYSGPLSINAYTTVKAIAIASGYQDSLVGGAFYPQVDAGPVVFARTRAISGGDDYCVILCHTGR